MREPILHSELADMLMELEGGGLTPLHDRIMRIITATSGGVGPEGGFLDPDDPTRPRFVYGISRDADRKTTNVKPLVSGFRFGRGSMREMEGVDTRLVKVAMKAIEITTQDFTFFDGLRTLKEQERLVKEGKSKTINSKHLEGLAMDLVPYHNGRPTWDWKLIYPVVLAVDKAATQLGYAHLITWGGAWDRTLADFGGSESAYEKEVRAYCDRHPGKDFIDGPHYQIRGPRQ